MPEQPKAAFYRSTYKEDPDDHVPTDRLGCPSRPPKYVHMEFIVPLAADVDVRCSCPFMEFTEADDREQGAVFAWNEACVIHPKMPPRRWLDE